ncbi:MAG: hypothetical protein ACK4E0_18215 [Chitinophagaceae bacterium]
MSTAKPKPRAAFFFHLSLFSLLLVVAGFFLTFIKPSLQGRFKAPPIVYIHGMLALAWVLLLLAQTWLVRQRRTLLHMRLGRIGMLLAIGILITMVPMGQFQTQKDLAAGLGEFAYPVQLGTIISGLLFASLVALGIYWRKRPATHKRLLIIATIVLLWPAWFRLRHYFPQIPRPDIWLAYVAADSLILVCWLWDWLKNRQIHLSWLFAGLFVIVEQGLEVFVYFNWPAFRAFSKDLYILLS